MIHKLSPLQLLLTLLAVVGLAIDAYVHFDVAHNYDANATTTMSQGDLFRIEAVAAIVVAVLIIALPRWFTAALATLVALVAAVAVLYSVYNNIPSIGPAPKIYAEPWYGEKTLSFIAEVVAFVAAGALALVSRPRTTTAETSDSRPKPGHAASV